MKQTVSKAGWLSKGRLFSFFLGLTLAFTVWWSWGQGARERSQVLSPIPADTPLAEIARIDMVGAEIFFPTRDLSGIRRFSLPLQDFREDLPRWTATILSALTRVPAQEVVAIFPEAIRPRHVFLDERQTLYLDLPGEMVRSLMAGVELESLSVEALIRSLGANIAGVRRVKLLVDGSDRETLWGHVYLWRPFRVPPPDFDEL